MLVIPARETTIPHIDRIRSEVRRLHLLNSKNVDMDLAMVADKDRFATLMSFSLEKDQAQHFPYSRTHSAVSDGDRLYSISHQLRLVKLLCRGSGKLQCRVVN